MLYLVQNSHYGNKEVIDLRKRGNTFKLFHGGTLASHWTVLRKATGKDIAAASHLHTPMKKVRKPRDFKFYENEIAWLTAHDNIHLNFNCRIDAKKARELAKYLNEAATYLEVQDAKKNS